MKWFSNWPFAQVFVWNLPAWKSRELFIPFHAVRYFSALGLSAEGTERISRDLIPASLDEVCTEINNSLDYHEKVGLLLLVQDSLLALHDAPGFDELSP